MNHLHPLQGMRMVAYHQISAGVDKGVAHRRLVLGQVALQRCPPGRGHPPMDGDDDEICHVGSLPHCLLGSLDIFGPSPGVHKRR